MSYFQNLDGERKPAAASSSGLVLLPNGGSGGDTVPVAGAFQYQFAEVDRAITNLAKSQYPTNYAPHLHLNRPYGNSQRRGQNFNSGSSFNDLRYTATSSFLPPPIATNSQINHHQIEQLKKYNQDLLSRYQEPVLGGSQNRYERYAHPQPAHPQAFDPFKYGYQGNGVETALYQSSGYPSNAFSRPSSSSPNSNSISNSISNSNPNSNPISNPNSNSNSNSTSSGNGLGNSSLIMDDDDGDKLLSSIHSASYMGSPWGKAWGDASVSSAPKESSHGILLGGNRGKGALSTTTSVWA